MILDPGSVRLSTHGYCTQNLINIMVLCTHMCTQMGNVHTTSFNVHNLISQQDQLKSPIFQLKVLWGFQAKNIANALVMCTYGCTQLGNVHATYYYVHHHIFQSNKNWFLPNFEHDIFSGYWTQIIFNIMVACKNMCMQCYVCSN